MKIKVWVERPKCATFASCTIADDPIFVLDDEGKAILDVEKLKGMPVIKSITEEKAEDQSPCWILESDDAKWIEDNVTAGAMRCPVFAIHVTDLETNTIIFPQA